MSVTALRSASPEDAAEIARLATELGYQANEGQMRARLERLTADATQYVCVASVGADRLSGWIHAGQTLILESGEAVEIMGLIVDPSARRQAIGRALVLAAERWACASGAHRIVVRSNVVRTEAHEFYPALGYALSKTQQVYRKSLDTTLAQ